MIFTPHMDDEVIGCGGLIRQASEQGIAVLCVFLTDGAFGFQGQARLNAAATRKLESIQALKVLGCEHALFLDEPDGALGVNRGVVTKLKHICEREKPDILLFPYPFDRHSDHSQVFSLIKQALDERALDHLQLMCYQVRVPLAPAHIDTALDISPVRKCKEEALRLFASQNHIDFGLYLHLQACQGYLTGMRRKTVEVFSCVDRERYRNWSCEDHEKREAVTCYREVVCAIFRPCA